MEIVRAYYSDKKRRWAKNKTGTYTPEFEWGEKRGYDLAPPMPVAEVEAFEACNGVRLPEAYRDYLLKVSRETFFGSFPILGKFRSGPMEKCSFPEGVDHVYWDEVDEEANMMDGMTMIVEDGCDSNTHLVINGNRTGTVWSMGTGGDSVHLMPGGFEDFVTPGRQMLATWDRMRQDR